MHLFKNKEVKLIIITTLITFLVFLTGFIFVTNKWFNNINLEYIKQNTALVGAIIENSPELEEDIVPIITKGKIEKYYEAGSNVLDKYYYNENLSTIKNPILNKSYEYFTVTIIFLWLLFFTVVILLILRIISPIFNNIKLLGQEADEIVEGNFNSGELKFEEGDFYIFYNKFTQMGERLNNALKDLQDEKVNLKDIINDISHQLKTPLSALIAYNDILKNHKNMDMETKSKFINLTSEQLDRMDWLITTLLKYARIESNAVKYNKEIIPLSETIKYAIEPLKVSASEKEQHIVLELNNEGYYLHDKKWIAESISNIIKNAIEHMDTKGEIKIILEETPLSVSISIRDNGEGIEKSELKKIFKRFYKGKNSVNPKSIGIGLSLSKKIIEAHGGSITVDSELGKGTVFNIIFLKAVV
ncbi:HAMP domain-containing sensor histidine kinase [Clostridium sp. AL.422]|uniref:sensor histidine kinase n=1 Tax=Clostridium TaxID=1485 RepID=UPI00293DF785|nr:MULTISPECIES: HAMP domain-containing sensor histidine kinase [unclassified Clostridium]MDV4151968.1 HAMP domain-containing sensor histidine kinase [Clostridium sp. AL.422]